MIKLPLRLLSLLGFGVDVEERNTLVSDSCARRIPDWTLFIGVDDSGAAYAYSACPQWAEVFDEWLPSGPDNRHSRIPSGAIDWPRLERHRIPGQPAPLYVLPEPARNFERRPSRWERFRRTVKRG